MNTNSCPSEPEGCMTSSVHEFMSESELMSVLVYPIKYQSLQFDNSFTFISDHLEIKIEAC